MAVKIKLLSVVFALFFANTLVSQPVSYDFSVSSIVERLQKDISTLASDELEGREAGTPGEEKTVSYIKQRFEEIDLQPLFGGLYIQSFEFHGEWVYTEMVMLKINDTEYNAGESFFPMVESGDASVAQEVVYLSYGYKNDTLEWNDYKEKEHLDEKIYVMEYYLPDSLYEKLDVSVDEAIHTRIETAMEKGSSGIIFVNSHNPDNDPTISLRRRTQRWDIPIAFAGYNVYEHLEREGFDAELTYAVELESEQYTGKNVAAYLDNGAERTVVVGAHHDHLGYGGRTSRHTGDPEIHPGADDNASGVAGVLETARYISNQDWTGSNYLFITFSAEEKGLLGSRHFVESDAYDMERINYMFNFDMIGRMEDNNLILIGTGTSPSWESIITETQPEGFNIRKVQSGVGGSDHTSFYMQDIPVIFFFTGIHDDYHDIGDVHEKINYEGQKQILQFAWEMMEKLDESEKLEFTETPVDRSRRRRADGVTMGLMPDHAFDGTGLKIHKIVEGRPAHEGGLLDGDIIIALNEYEIEEIHSYMRALQNFEEGDVVTVTLIRDDKKLELEVEF